MKPMKPTKPASPLTVTPEVGWELHSQYGALKDVDGKPLERLEAVHALLMKRDGLTSMDAAVRVFGPFLADGNSEIGLRHGAAKLRPFLMLCDKSDRAYSLFPSSEYSDRSHLERLAELMPYVPHHHFDRDTPEALLYALAQMAGEVWAPYSGDFDLNDRPCAAFAEGYFTTVAKAREILGPLAVRHDLAHKLWGWGVVDAAAVDANAASAPPVAKQKKVPQREHCPELTGARLKARRDELKRNGEKKHTQVLMVESGLPDREIRRRISEHDAGSAAMADMASQLQPKKPKAA